MIKSRSEIRPAVLNPWQPPRWAAGAGGRRGRRHCRTATRLHRLRLAAGPGAVPYGPIAQLTHRSEFSVTVSGSTPGPAAP
eukprot:459204-Hanusia_phi.AAC.1